jgi:PilZ domain-containing protein
VTKQQIDERDPSQWRKFERVDIAFSAGVQVLDSKGKKVGVLRQLGRGGFMMEPEKTYTKDGKTHRFTIYEPQEDIRVQVSARVLYSDPRYVGVEFVELDPENAVEIGIIIGKYYEAAHGH